MPLAAWFLGPRAENADLWQELLDRIFLDYVHWRRNYFPEDPIVVSRADRRSDAHEDWVDSLVAKLDEKLDGLKENFPFHSPRYNAHMLSELTLPSVLGYFSGMLYNPNNVTDEAAPVTVELEREVGQRVAAMLGYDRERAWAHLCSGGTIATLEALWVARTVQFLPFAVREYCDENKSPLAVGDKEIRKATDDDLLSLGPADAISLIEELSKKDDFWTQCYPDSRWNVRKYGLASVLAKVKLKCTERTPTPKIFVSGTTHYSVEKAADVLGYGEEAVVRLRCNDQFQLDHKHLRHSLRELKSHEYVAAVVGIVGTTEEGAVDPIHEIVKIRDEFKEKMNRSFWLHLDAAWGGYVRTAFLTNEEKPRFRESSDDCPSLRHLHAPIEAMSRSDSTTIDPHKLGYVPYPAGMVAFPNKAVKRLLKQRAPYIADDGADTQSDSDTGIGPYILEGSKPGAAALACWLAHETIPLDESGHGQLIRTTLENARRLHHDLDKHKKRFAEVHIEAFKEVAPVGDNVCLDPFAFIPLHKPDTNIVCFVARPMMWRDDEALDFLDLPLKWTNELNERIWLATSIKPNPSAPSPQGPRRSSAQPFFVSRTELVPREGYYSAESVRDMLKRIGVKEDEYREEGKLFVLRSVVMNPWHDKAKEKGKEKDIDYLRDFVHHLHREAAAAMGEVLEAARK